MKQLTAAFVRSATLPGKYGDQHGLNRRVSPSESKQWIWWGTMRPKRRDVGLGGYPYTSLAEARQMAFEYRKLARSGGDPTALRRVSPRRASRRSRCARRRGRTAANPRTTGAQRSGAAPRRHARLRDHLRGRAGSAVAGVDNSPRNTDNTTGGFSSGLFFEAFAMLISLRQTQTAD